MKGIRVGLTLPEEMVKAIDDEAEREERTRSNYILWVLKKHLEGLEKQDGQENLNPNDPTNF